MRVDQFDLNTRVDEGGQTTSLSPRFPPDEIYSAFSLVQSFGVLKYFHDVATSAFLCHKEPAQCIHRIGGFHARKESILSAPNRFVLCMKPLRSLWMPLT